MSITGGEWKGYRGRVVQADDKSVMVELSSKCRKIPISRDMISLDININKQQGNDPVSMISGGNTVYESGKTPMNYNTPSYYP